MKFLYEAGKMFHSESLNDFGIIIELRNGRAIFGNALASSAYQKAGPEYLVHWTLRGFDVWYAEEYLKMIFIDESPI